MHIYSIQSFVSFAFHWRSWGWSHVDRKQSCRLSQPGQRAVPTRPLARCPWHQHDAAEATDPTMVFSRWRRVWWARCFFKIGGFDWPRFSMITTRLGLGTDACLYLGVLSDLYITTKAMVFCLSMLSSFIYLLIGLSVCSLIHLSVWLTLSFIRCVGLCVNIVSKAGCGHVIRPG